MPGCTQRLQAGGSRRPLWAPTCAPVPCGTGTGARLTPAPGGNNEPGALTPRSLTSALLPRQPQPRGSCSPSGALEAGVCLSSSPAWLVLMAHPPPLRARPTREPSTSCLPGPRAASQVHGAAGGAGSIHPSAHRPREIKIHGVKHPGARGLYLNRSYLRVYPRGFDCRTAGPKQPTQPSSPRAQSPMCHLAGGGRPSALTPLRAGPRAGIAWVPKLLREENSPAKSCTAERWSLERCWGTRAAPGHLEGHSSQGYPETNWPGGAGKH